MMLFQKLISMDCVKHAVQCSSKKRAFEFIAQTAANCLGNDNAMFFETLINREQKGITAIGNGVALPHGRITDDEQPIAIFLQLEEGINYDAPDKQPVDLIFALFIPQQMSAHFNEDFQIFHQCFKDKTFLKQLRRAKNEEDLFHILLAQDQFILNILNMNKTNKDLDFNDEQHNHDDG